MKYVGYLSLAIFTFLIGVAISPIRFYTESIACGRRGSTTGYRSSYFIRTSRSYSTYDTEVEARKTFNQALATALTIYDVSPKINKQGVPIDQRAVYLTYDQDYDEYSVHIAWREGRVLHGIHSRSFTHVKEFERQDF